MRDRIHDLNLDDHEDKITYEDTVFEFISFNEAIGGKPNLRAYHDGKNNISVGYGFNMTQECAMDIWNITLGPSTLFDDVKDGIAAITERQAYQLYAYFRKANLAALEQIYGHCWGQLKPNEMLMIEDAYYNGGSKLVGRCTRFCYNIIGYIKTSEPLYLKAALFEIKHRSNPDINTKVGKGIQNRRNAEAEMGNSLKYLNR